MAKRNHEIVIPEEIAKLTEKEARDLQEHRAFDESAIEALVETKRKAQAGIDEYMAFNLALGKHIINLIQKRIAEKEDAQ